MWFGSISLCALNILQPLYEACLDRMQDLLECADQSGNHPLAEFRKVLGQVQSPLHPNRSYFVLKSILVNNLYGLDIMKEAVEICKLRLFLKLVAQVERIEHLEPLPDIDFNIRAGNTLIGFATLADVEKTIQGILTDESVKNAVAVIVQEAKQIEQAYQMFHDVQTVMVMQASGLAKAKQTLRQKLDELTVKLDRYLAEEHTIDPDKPQELAKWLAIHQPFHWFAEFFGIMNRGGFNVIIGNPPYVVYTPAKVPYTIPKVNYKTFEAKNLYVYVYERSLGLAKKKTMVGLIVPLTVLSAERLSMFQKILMHRGRVCSVSFPRRPESVFDGVEMPVAIILSSSSQRQEIFSSRVERFYTEERPVALATLALANHNIRRNEHRIAKFGTSLELSINSKLGLQESTLNSLTKKGALWILYYQEACRYWVKGCVGMPFFTRNGKKIDPPHGRTMLFSSNEAVCFVACVANSSLFYWFYSAFSDCEHINDSLLREFPVPTTWNKSNWIDLYQSLAKDLEKNAKRKSIQTKQGHTIEYNEMKALLSKPFIDEIDHVLAKHYGFTDEELDFIINYDIKYRMGLDSEED
jgi:Eco57I restriction-modification methylase